MRYPPLPALLINTETRRLRRLIVSLLLGALVVIAITLVAQPAGAAHTIKGSGIEGVTSPLSGSLCLAEDSGTISSSVPVLNGELEIDSRQYLGWSGYGFMFGSWVLTPADTEGTMQGILFGRVQPGKTSQYWFGWGSDQLQGLSVHMKTSALADCDDKSGLAGTLYAMRSAPPIPDGSRLAISTQDFADTVASLTNAIEGNPNLGLVGIVDHQAGAASRGLTLLPTTELFFGNPGLGTPLMQSAQSTGIDLPQKMLIWQDELGQVKVAWNAPQYLVARHDLEGVDTEIETIGNALAGLASAATGTSISPDLSRADTATAEGLVIRRSAMGVDETFDAIVQALDAAPPINVVFTLEHDQNAARVGLDLAPTMLIVFGNPSLGTPLMQLNRSVALDMPQKILVWQDGDDVFVGYNDPAFVAQRHGISTSTPELATIAGALANFSSIVE